MGTEMEEETTDGEIATFELKGEYIELIKMLKVEGIAETGGQAKLMVEDGLVKLNGEPESRKRAKLRPGDLIEIEEFGLQIRIVAKA